jgi:hypothetical protein
MFYNNFIVFSFWGNGKAKNQKYKKPKNWRTSIDILANKTIMIEIQNNIPHCIPYNL